MRPAVDVIVPTYGRPEYHERLYGVFAHQTYAPRSLWVYDDSPRRSPFFTRLRDRRVHYLWSPHRVSIGAKRNHLTHWSRGVVLAAFDDDDWYAPAYLETMVGRLLSPQADLVKLSVWDAISAYDNSCWRWDTRVSGGTCYAVTGSGPPVQVVNCPLDVSAREAALIGYGFSYVYTRRAAERVPFEDINHGEDLAFVRRLGDLGGKIVMVDDRPSLVLHTLHAKSTSRSYPQTRLSGDDFGVEVEDAKDLHGGPIKLRKGKTYRLVARVKRTHTATEVRHRVEGSAEIISYVDPFVASEAAPKGYRHVEAVVKMRASEIVPRRLPPPFSVLDKTEILQVEPR